jgi:hypothetical protein
MLGNWNTGLARVATQVSVDPEGTVDLSPFGGPEFRERALACIPLRDLSFGAPAWMGTGDTATRLRPRQSLPQVALEHPTLLWVAIG